MWAKKKYWKYSQLILHQNTIDKYLFKVSCKECGTTTVDAIVMTQSLNQSNYLLTPKQLKAVHYFHKNAP